MLQRMAVFIKQQSLRDRNIDQFSQLNHFGAVAWEFVSTIYMNLDGTSLFIRSQVDLYFFYFFIPSTIYYTEREGRPW